MTTIEIILTVITIIAFVLAMVGVFYLVKYLKLKKDQDSKKLKQKYDVLNQKLKEQQDLLDEQIVLYRNKLLDLSQKSEDEIIIPDDEVIFVK